jgi:hypothetical protein
MAIPLQRLDSLRAAPRTPADAPRPLHPSTPAAATHSSRGGAAAPAGRPAVCPRGRERLQPAGRSGDV